jgi:misacylated tRNA(Ala) deacylase
MDTYGDLETLGWGMGSDGGMNYVELGRKPTEQEIKDIQRRCNEIIAKNVAIKVETPLDAKTDSLPADYDKDKGIVRVIKIGDIDENPCCGTHLSQTSHISLILLHHTQPIRGTNTRLFFTCGDRAIQLATAATQAIRSISSILSHGSTPAEVVEKVEKVSNGYRDASRRTRKLETELARYEAERVERELASKGRSWVYRADVGMDYITAVTQGLNVGDGVVILAAGEGADGGPVVVMGNEKLVEELVAKVKDAVKGVKGGGKGGRWQGKVAAWGKGEVEALRRLVESE